ncbi:MAG TPA: hypothetical protein VJ456_16130 [Acidimicrobiia bacterium]|nr:hypothetical protein [Acidimicrobiia bacterium]
MSESTPETAVENVEQQAQVAEPKVFDEAYVKELRAEAAKYRTEAKQYKSEVEKVRQASLSEAEKAVLEAEQRGRLSVLADFGQKLARSAFVAEAARRNSDYDAAAVLDDLNLSRYIGEDGEPDSKAIAAAVARLVPEPSAGPRGVGNADLGGRSAGAALPLNGDPILNSLKSKLGI